MSPRPRADRMEGDDRKSARTALCAVLAVVVLGFSAAEGSGQAPRWEVDLNASRIQFDTAAALNAPSVSSLLEWRRPSLFGRASGSLTGFEGAGWSVQGRGDLAGWDQPGGASSPFRLELAAAGRASRHSSGFSSGVARVDGRAHLMRPDVGAWAGVGGAVAKNSRDTTAFTAVVPSIGVWGQRGPIRATASYLHTVLEGEAFPEGRLVVSLSRGVLDLSAYAGFRLSPFEGDDLDESWGGASAAIWVRDNAAIIVSGGRYSSDVLQGLPGGDFVSIGFRLAARRDRPIPRRTTAPIVYTEESVRERGIALSVPDADRVEVAGDFNGWTLEPLEQDASGQWVLPGDLEPGVYRFNLRVDGERWIVPEGVPSVDDGFGDRVGLLIISAGSNP